MTNQPDVQTAAEPLGPDGQPLSFGQAMSRLEQIVASLNNPNMDLEQAMNSFKEGLLLSQYCQNQLDSFQNEIDVLMQNNNSGAAHA